jgi:hypothetical protein
VAAEGARALTQAEIVELADAVAVHGGIASGIGSTRFGAQLIVDAGSRDEAMTRGAALFTAAVTQAGLPAAPIVQVEAVGEEDDLA